MWWFDFFMVGVILILVLLLILRGVCRVGFVSCLVVFLIGGDYENR